MAGGNTHLAKAAVVGTEIEEVAPWRRALFTLGKFVVGIAVGIAATAAVAALLAGTVLSGGLVAGVIVGVVGFALTMADTIHADLNDDKPLMQKLDDFLYECMPKSPCGKVAIGAKTVTFEGKAAANVHMTKADWEKFAADAEKSAKESQARKDKWASGLGGKASVIAGHIKDMGVGMAKGLWEGLKGPFVKPPPPPVDACQVACKNHGNKMFAQGSDSVFVEECHPAVRLGDETECAAKPVELGHAKTVIIGGESVTYKDIQRGSVWANFLISAFTVILIVYAIGKGAMKLGKKIKCARGATGLKNKLKAFWKDPIFAPNGSVFDSRDDFVIPNNLNLDFSRDYSQFYTDDDQNGLGLGWKSNWGQKIVFKGKEAYFCGFGDEEDLVFHVPHEYGLSTHLFQSHLVLDCQGQQLHLIDKATDTVRIFEKSKDGKTAWLVKYLDNLTQTGYRFYYDEDGLVSKVVTTEGLEVVTERAYKRYQKIYVIENGDKTLLSEYIYDDNLQLTYVNSRQFGEFHYTYDEKGRMSSWGDSQYVLASYIYDDKDRCIHTEGANGYYTGHFTYDEKNRRTIITDEFGQNIIDYDENRNITQHIDPLGRIASYEYNQNNLIIKSTAHNGQVEEVSYNDYGQILTYKDSIDPKNTAYEYDENGRLIKVIYGDDCITLTRNNKGLVTCEDYNGKYATNYKYDTQGQLIETKTDKGNSIHFDYDHYNRLIEIKDKKYSFKQKNNIFAQIVSTEDSLGHKEQFTYSPHERNPRGELSSYINADGERFNFIYNSEGMLESIEDADGISGKAVYGPFDTLAEIRMSSGGRYSFKYDSELRLTHVINPHDEEYIYSYDAVGRLIKEQDFASRVTEFTYDDQDLLIEKKSADGSIFTYKYDDQWRMIKEEIIDPSKDKDHSAYRLITEFTYDDNGNIIQAKNNDSLVFHEYDDEDRIIKETSQDYERSYEYKEEEDQLSVIIKDNRGYHQEINYDHEDDLKSIQVNQHSRLDFSFNEEGTSWLARNQQGFLQSEQYSRSGKIQHQWSGHFKGDIKDFDALRKKEFDKHLSPKTATERHYRWSQGSRLLKVDDHHFGEKKYSHTKDGQIQQVSYESKMQYGEEALAAESFLYDKNNNISHTRRMVKQWQDMIKGDGGRLSEAKHHYDKGGLIRDIIVGSGHRVQYHYDACSRVIKKIEHKNGFRAQIWHYEWDAKNRLICTITPRGERIIYRYDPFNRRISQTIFHDGSPKSKAFYNYQGVQLAYVQRFDLRAAANDQYAAAAKQAVGGETSCHYVYNDLGAMVPMAQRQDGVLSYIAIDQVGMPKELISEDGTLLWAKEHYLWGKTLKTHQAVNDHISCDLRFPGQYEDIDTGLFYNYHRYYDPDTGQYLSPDPIGLSGGLRPQAYVEDPTGWVDFLGLTTYPSGMKYIPGYARHHIFPHSLQKSLAGLGININSPRNLIYLPDGGKINVGNKGGLLDRFGIGKTYHKGFPQAHRDYNKLITDRLDKILNSNKSKIGKLREIAKLRKSLRQGLKNGDIDLTTKADGSSTITGC